MTALRVRARRLLGLFRTRYADETLDAELRAHLQFLTDEYIRRGLNPEQARHAAHREFGGIEQTKEAYRDQRGFPFAARYHGSEGVLNRAAILMCHDR